MGTGLRRDRDAGKRLNPHEASERRPNNARSRGSLQGALTTFGCWRDRSGKANGRRSRDMPNGHTRPTTDRRTPPRRACAGPLRDGCAAASSAQGPVVTLLRRFWLQNFRLNVRDDDALYADDRVRWRAEIDGNLAARTMVASAYDLDVHNAKKCMT